MVDEENQKILGLTSVSINKICFGNAIVENVATGCTIVLNKKAVKLFNQKTNQNKILMHDWWIYLVVTAVGGKVLYDETPHIHYRQHSSNTLGNASGIKIWKHKMKHINSRKKRAIQSQVEELIAAYSDQITDKNKKIIARFLAINLEKSKSKKAWILLWEKSFYRQKFINNLIMKILMFFNVC
jgi:hypothetical protein